MKVMIVGGGGREHAIAKAISRSSEYSKDKTYGVMKNLNPGIARICGDYKLIPETDVESVVSYAKEKGVEMVFIGPEAPLEAGLADALDAEGIGAVGPTKDGAMIETSKSFMRELMAKHGIKGCPEFRVFHEAKHIEEYIRSLGSVAVKPIGLTGGKGVKVSGDHFHHVDEAVAYAKVVIEKGIGGGGVVIEEKLVGEEFTLQAFADGRTLRYMPCVQDHKRAFEGDKGPNTGGMGSYSQSDGLLPFLTMGEVEEAKGIMKAVLDAMVKEGIKYRGIMYGQFILTAQGPKVIEINARFGDPEAMNVLPLLESDILDIGRGIVEGSLQRVGVRFRPMSTVCKYVVPRGYGIKPVKDAPITVDEKGIGACNAILFYASVNERAGKVYTTSSRSLAVVGIGEGLYESESRAECGLKHINGRDIFIRHDIGKREVIEAKVRRMETLRKTNI